MMDRKPVKSRRDGTSLALTIPAKCSKVEHDRQLIDEAFAGDHLLDEEEMEKLFGKYGWGK